jgi:hypothetical protein
MTEPTTSSIATLAPLVNYIDADQLKRDMDYNLADISEAMRTHPGIFFHYASQSVKARAQSDRAKSLFEVTESVLDRRYRTLLKEENPKTTEPMIRSSVVTDPEWKAAHNRMNMAATIYRLCETAERSFEHRKDMMLQIARNMAKEQDGSLRVVKNQDSRQRLLDVMKGAGKEEGEVTETNH